MPKRPERRTPMRSRLFATCSTFFLGATLSWPAAEAAPPAAAELDALARSVAEGEPGAADAAAEALRAAGPAGLDALLALLPRTDAPRTNPYGSPDPLATPDATARRAHLFAA